MSALPIQSGLARRLRFYRHVLVVFRHCAYGWLAPRHLSRDEHLLRDLCALDDGSGCFLVLGGARGGARRQIGRVCDEKRSQSIQRVPNTRRNINGDLSIGGDPLNRRQLRR